MINDQSLHDPKNKNKKLNIKHNNVQSNVNRSRQLGLGFCE